MSTLHAPATVTIQPTTAAPPRLPTSFPRAEAFRLGFEPCGLCDPALPLLPDDGFQLPEDEPVVYYMVQDGYYHDSDTCSKIEYNDYGTLPVAVTLDEALYLEKKPCKHCHPAK